MYTLRSKSSTSLPNNPEIAYGKKVIPDAEGALQIALKWKEFKPCPEKHVLERDFRQLNKQSIRDGIVSPREVYEFRKTHDARIHPKKKEALVDLPSNHNPDYAYGHTNHFDLKAKDLMEHKFEDEWLKQREIENRHREEERIRIAMNSVNIKAKKEIQKNSEKSMAKLHHPPEKESFKMSRFKEVPPKVDSHSGRSSTNSTSLSTLSLSSLNSKRTKKDHF